MGKHPWGWSHCCKHCIIISFLYFHWQKDFLSVLQVKMPRISLHPPPASSTVEGSEQVKVKFWRINKLLKGLLHRWASFSVFSFFLVF